MTEPSTDRVQQGVPTASGTGDNGDLGSFEDVPLTRDEALERDAANDDDQPARTSPQPELAQRATDPGT